MDGIRVELHKIWVVDENFSEFLISEREFSSS